MLQAKCPTWLLLVASLLVVVISHSTEHPEEHVLVRGGQNAAIGKLESFDFTFNSTNVTHFAYGIAANAVAVLLYGSNFVPIKRIETGDGMFYQWVNCAAIWVVSMVGNLMLESPRFHPLAMVGGAIWATGNIAVVPIVKAIGLGLGILIWGSSSLLMGWASSRFGWFGITAQDVPRPILNYCGAGLCLLSGLIFFFVKADVELHTITESIPLLLDRRTISGSYAPRSSEFWIDRIGPKTRRFIGSLLAVLSGLLYGSSFTPILYIKSRSMCQESVFHGASDYDLDYVHAQCSGIFVTSTLYFAIYCAAMKNRPRVYSGAILPGLLSGLMWSLATYCWFLANTYLSAVITFPIVTAGYGLVAALWGALVFKEIKGLANCFIFFSASCVVLTGSVLTAISKL
ncbi:putative transmembrane protein 144 isoform 2 [Scophthalmus maximus]|uniref:Putative transmembrane protein 144 isoform 2 n=1 Tax=Scophthalmus maximus TaxID=52904 RepID=A0A2U9C577_SCOMX|nr:transmembrane protein 144b isoform X1 [Scophthalmus maximus]AWP11721.1 putative transmembrane protein 144 isoform 2 [Scophthalmus maximus]